MSNQKIDGLIISGFVSIAGVIIFLYCFGGYVHYQFSSAVDCSLLTTPSIYEDKNSDIGMRMPGQILTIQQTRDLCFDINMIHKFEMCYYVNCGNDVNHTVNYESKSIQISLAEPAKPHMYPKPNEKFTIFDVYSYDIVIGTFLFVPILAIIFPIVMFRDPKPDYRPHGTLPKGFDRPNNRSDKQ